MALGIARGEEGPLTDGPALFEKETIFQIVKSFQVFLRWGEYLYYTRHQTLKIIY